MLFVRDKFSKIFEDLFTITSLTEITHVNAEANVGDIS